MFYTFVKCIAFVIFHIIFRIKVEGKDNIPLEGRLVLCANHHRNWDPILIATVFSRKISWMGKKELFKNKFFNIFLNWLLVFPVDREVNDIGAVKKALRVLKAEKVLGIFPEGTRVYEFNPENAKAGVALLALKSNSPVIPVYIKSSYKLFSKVCIYIGKPINYKNIYPGKLDMDQYNIISQDILAKIYALGG